MNAQGNYVCFLVDIGTLCHVAICFQYAIFSVCTGIDCLVHFYAFFLQCTRYKRIPKVKMCHEACVYSFF